MNVGTTPAGTETEQQAAAWVQQMFAGIAPRYDLLNHLLSFNIDRGWRKALMRNLEPVLARADAAILDLCCGTGDVLFDFERVSQSARAGRGFLPSHAGQRQREGRAKEVAGSSLRSRCARASARTNAASMPFRLRSGFGISQITNKAWPNFSACSNQAGYSPSWSSPIRAERSLALPMDFIRERSYLGSAGWFPDRAKPIPIYRNRSGNFRSRKN